MIENFIRDYAEKHGLAAAKVIHPLRLALTGKTESPGIFELIYVLGKEKICRRLKAALDFVESMLKKEMI
jgi:glutamyl-tRNA synthetase